MCCGGGGCSGGGCCRMEDVKTSPKDICQILKGKRTKRQRPESPIPFTVITHSSSGDGECIENINKAISTNMKDEFLGTTNTTEEDVYMANCLILLSQGLHHSRETVKKIDHNQYFGTDHKFTSKRYIETPISVNGKAGMYVYQCKTCGRSFSSFQALGGHRASHKKPKNIAAEERKMFLPSSDDEYESLKISNHGSRNRKFSSLTLELSSRGIYNTDSNKSSTPTPKVHACACCGAEFASGQALGGHMRRHRGATISTTNTTLSLSLISPDSNDQETDETEAKRRRYNLSLDLNLPAPEDDHHGDSMSAFVPKQPHQQQEQQHKQAQQGNKEQEKQTTLDLTGQRLIECRI